MIYSLNGRLIQCDFNSAVVECGGVGMMCLISTNTAKKLPPVGQDVFIFTHLGVKEDALDLYGFADKDELAMFKLLISVSGVGAKIALSILGQFDANGLAVAISSGDAKSLTRASGVGAKMAQRICLELKDKVGGSGISLDESVTSASNASGNQNTRDAVEALTSLGYSQSEASVAVGRLDSNLPVETLIRDALISLAKKL